MAHSHPSARPAEAASTAVRRGLALVIVPLIAALGVGLVLLWPGERLPVQLEGPLAPERARGSVVGTAQCPPELELCSAVQVALIAGPGAPATVVAILPYGDQAPVIETGDRLVLSYFGAAPEGQAYQFIDFDRRLPLYVLGGLFVVVVVAFARWRGVTSLLALAFSLFVFVAFVLRGLLAGEPPLGLALVGAGVIMVVTLYLGHGVNAPTSVALLGTLVSLGVTAALGVAVTAVSHFVGLSDDYFIYLDSIVPGIDFTGLLLAGLIIGALGVLDDVTVTQAAVVWELDRADPTATTRELFTAGMRVGRSHVQATINTLVLAYAGAGLPLFVFLAVSDIPLLDALTTETVAQEVVGAAVGSIGIVCAVPVTTAIAAFVVRSTAPSGSS